MEKQTHRKTFIKTILYRIYATIIFTTFAYFIFSGTFEQTMNFAVGNIFLGLMVYYSFERLWIYFN